jgi:hypothetical protein
MRGGLTELCRLAMIGAAQATARRVRERHQAVW